MSETPKPEVTNDSSPLTDALALEHDSKPRATAASTGPVQISDTEQREIDREMEAMVLRELGDILGLRGQPHLVSIHRRPQSMPQYDVGHLARVAWIEGETSRHNRLYLTGNAYRGIGLGDCIHQAEKTAEEVAANGF